jgi:hypothetical protein
LVGCGRAKPCPVIPPRASVSNGMCTPCCAILTATSTSTFTFTFTFTFTSLNAKNRLFHQSYD